MGLYGYVLGTNSEKIPSLPSVILSPERTPPGPPGTADKRAERPRHCHGRRTHRDRARSASRSRSKNWRFSTSNPPTLSFRLRFQPNYHFPLHLRIFDDSSKVGITWNIWEQFQKNPPLPTGGSEPPVVPPSDHWKREQMVRPAALSHRRLTCRDRARSNAPYVEKSRQLTLRN